MTASAAKAWSAPVTGYNGSGARGAPLPEKEDLTLCCFRRIWFAKTPDILAAFGPPATNLRRNTCERNITTWKNIGSEPAGS
jgi:hypothetical protein